MGTTPVRFWDVPHQHDPFFTKEYTSEQFKQDLGTYINHIEGRFRHLKLVGVVPKDRGGEHKDPELNAIFVPLRIGPLDQTVSASNIPTSIITWLEKSQYL